MAVNEIRKVLMVAFAFPPTAGSGSLRSLKFAKYLPQFGWEPVVLTVNEKYSEKVDLSLMKELPACVTIKTTSMSKPIDALVQFRNRFRLKSRTTTDEIISTTPSSGPAAREKGISPSGLLLDWLSCPDKNAGWIPWAILPGLKLIRKYHPKVIYTTSPPSSTHIIGYYLKKFSGLPWVVDFRDPWNTASPGKSDKRRRMEDRLKMKVIRYADRIIANTIELQDALYKAYPDLPKNKVVVIPNGYDAEDFAGMQKESIIRNGKFVISHVGEFYPDGRRPDNFLKAVAELIKEDALPQDNIHVNFVGDTDYAFSQEFRKLLESLKLETIVSVKKHVSHAESLSVLFASDLLLLLQTGERFNQQIPAKIYEYIAAERPILALAPEGATTNLIKRDSLGVVVHPQDIEAMKKEIIRLFALRRENRKDILHTEPGKYDRKKLTEELSLLFDSVIRS